MRRLAAIVAPLVLVTGCMGGTGPEAFPTTSQAPICGVSATDFGYVKVLHSGYIGATSASGEPGSSYHAWVWGERETWCAADGSGRNHQVTEGPGFDSLEDADAWLRLGGREPLEGPLTFDRAQGPASLTKVDLECLARADPAEARDRLSAVADDPVGVFDVILREVRNRGGLSDEARGFVVDYLAAMPDVAVMESGHSDALGREGLALGIERTGRGGNRERLVAVFDATDTLLEYREEQIDAPSWAYRRAPFVSHRETVLATSRVPTIASRPDGVDPVTDPTRPATPRQQQLVAALESGLGCDELLAVGVSYSEAVVYWAIHGRPFQLDADRDGMPCDETFDERTVDAFWPEAPTGAPARNGDARTPELGPVAMCHIAGSS